MHLIDAVKQRIARSIGGPRFLRGSDALPTVESFSDKIESILRNIDFEEVTVADRITFVELAVDWQVCRVLERNRFDLAVELRKFGERQIARLRTDEEFGDPN
jgi:hypothetical protein